MQLTIVLRKEVPDEQTAQTLFNVVTQKLEDHPDVKITGQVSTSLELTPEVPS